MSKLIFYKNMKNFDLRKLQSLKFKYHLDRTNQQVEALSSTAKSIEDTWLVPNQGYSTTGGGRQLFSGQKDAFDTQK